MAPDPSPATSEVAYLDLAQLRAHLASGELTSQELTETLLRRIEDLDSPQSDTALRSVLAVSDRAVAEARRSDERRHKERHQEKAPRPLEGIPVLVKDSIEVAGLPSCAGSTSLIGRPPAADAPLVARLRDAGAVILGTTNLSEWSNIRSTRSTGGWSAVGGLTGNPWALDRNAGGSSSGSGAALAAGLAPLAVGAETDGSITCPCSVNGVAGIKPAVGAVPSAGIVPISPSQDSAGPMARTCADVAVLLEVMTGPGPRGGPEQPVRVGAADTWKTGHPATDALFEETVGALRDQGVEVITVSPAVPGEEEEADELTVLLCELKDALDRYLPTRGPDGPQSLAEVIAHEDSHRDVERAWFGHDLFERAAASGGTQSEDYRQARKRNLAWAIGTCLEPVMSQVDILLAPTYGPAWKSDLVLGGHPAAAAPTTMAPAIAGWPIATVPMGLAGGLPVGLGLIGRPGSEADLLALGASAERPLRPSWSPGRRG